MTGGTPFPVTTSTEPPVGGAALRVAVVDGTVQGGAALPVYVVSDAEVAAGYEVQGNAPIPVQAVTGRPIFGMRPIAVYVVSGSLNPLPTEATAIVLEGTLTAIVLEGTTTAIILEM